MELPPDLVEHLISLGPEDAVAYLLGVPTSTFRWRRQRTSSTLCSESSTSAPSWRRSCCGATRSRRSRCSSSCRSSSRPSSPPACRPAAAGLPGQYLTPGIVAEVLRQPARRCAGCSRSSRGAELLPEMAVLVHDGRTTGRSCLLPPRRRRGRRHPLPDEGRVRRAPLRPPLRNRGRPAGGGGAGWRAGRRHSAGPVRPVRGLELAPGGAGVDEAAVRAAYRLALKWHPDKNEQSEEAGR